MTTKNNEYVVLHLLQMSKGIRNVQINMDAMLIFCELRE